MISILGCGWLGMPLAKELSKKFKGVKGSTTRKEKLEEISNNGISPYLITLASLKAKNVISFLDNEILIINVPPGRSATTLSPYLQNLENLNSFIGESNIKKVIFISSTSVYKENNGVVTEDSEVGDGESALKMFNAEEIFRNNQNIETTVVRMSGLIGPNRHPGRFFSGKEDIPNGLSPVNLIHLDDCIGIIQSIIGHNYWDKTINASALSHPSKKEFYTKAIHLYNGTKAGFKDENVTFKIISSDKLLYDLNYKFKHPDLMKWLAE